MVGVTIDVYDMDRPLPTGLGAFDVVVSSFAIHHLVPERQRALYGEIRGAPARWLVRECRARRLEK